MRIDNFLLQRLMIIEPRRKKEEGRFRLRLSHIRHEPFLVVFIQIHQSGGRRWLKCLKDWW